MSCKSLRLSSSLFNQRLRGGHVIPVSLYHVTIWSCLRSRLLLAQVIPPGQPTIRDYWATITGTFITLHTRSKCCVLLCDPVSAMMQPSRFPDEILYANWLSSVTLLQSWPIIGWLVEGGEGIPERYRPCLLLFQRVWECGLQYCSFIKFTLILKFLSGNFSAFCPSLACHNCVILLALCHFTSISFLVDLQFL